MPTLPAHPDPDQLAQQARQWLAADPLRAREHWLRLVYAGDVCGSLDDARPALAARVLTEQPELADGDPALACAIGDVAALHCAYAQDPGSLHRPAGPLQLPPLVAVTHSSLLRLPAFRPGLHACARWLLQAGADPRQSIGNRWPPASLQSPSATEHLSALYGAAGRNHDAELTALLLAAGADPNDGESLYHALESPACTRLLLEAGARVAGSNAMYRVLDLDALDSLRLLLAHGGDANEVAASAPTNVWGRPLLWAIRRRRSAAHIAVLLQAGADPQARTADGTDAATLAMRHGLPEVAELLGQAGVPLADTLADRFVAACARGDESEARRLQQQDPALPAALPPAQLRLLPELAAEGCTAAVQTMVCLGWPVATRGGDWDASALNHAVFRGDAGLTRFLLAQGAQWTERHGFGDDCSGTLSWASCNTPATGTGGGDWVGCARALRDAGMPPGQPDPDEAEALLIGGRRKRFSKDVRAVLLDGSLGADA